MEPLNNDNLAELLPHFHDQVSREFGTAASLLTDDPRRFWQQDPTMDPNKRPTGVTDVQWKAGIVMLEHQRSSHDKTADSATRLLGAMLADSPTALLSRDLVAYLRTRPHPFKANKYLPEEPDPLEKLILIYKALADKILSGHSAMITEIKAIKSLIETTLPADTPLSTFQDRWLTQYIRLKRHYGDSVSERFYANIAVNAMVAHDKLLADKMFTDVNSGKDMSTVDAVFAAAAQHRQVMELASGAGHTALVAVGKTQGGGEKSARSHDKTGGGGKSDWCSYCAATGGSAPQSHNTCGVDGEILCWKFLRRLHTDTEYAARMKQKAESSVSKVKKSTMYHTLQSTIDYISQYIKYSLAASHLDDSARTTHRTALVYDSGSDSNIMNDKRWFLRLTPIPTRHIKGIGGSISITHRGMTIFGSAYLAESLALSILSPHVVFDEQTGICSYDGSANKYTCRIKDVLINFERTADLRVPHATLEPTTDVGSLLSRSSSTVSKWCNALIAEESSDFDESGMYQETPIFRPTPRLLEKAKAARALHRSLNHPPNTTLGRSLRAGTITDTRVVASDLDLADKVFGACPDCTARKRHEVRGGQYQPAEFCGQHIRADIVHLRGLKGMKMPYHFCVDERSGAQWLDKLQGASQLSYNAAQVHKAQLKRISYFRAHGHTVRRFYYDDDKVVKATEQALGNQGVQLLQWPPRQHEPVAESHIRTLNADLRVLITSLPYVLPEALVPYAAQDICMTRRTLCNSQSGSESPHMIIEGEKPSAHAFHFSFGMLVNTHTDSSSQQSPNSLSCQGIIVSRDVNVNHKCEVYLLHTGEVVDRAIGISDIISLPYPPQLVTLINNLTSTPYISDALIEFPATVGDMARGMDDPYGNFVNSNRRANEQQQGQRSASRQRAKATATISPLEATLPSLVPMPPPPPLNATSSVSPALDTASEAVDNLSTTLPKRTPSTKRVHFRAGSPPPQSATAQYDLDAYTNETRTHKAGTPRTTQNSRKHDSIDVEPVEQAPISVEHSESTDTPSVTTQSSDTSSTGPQYNTRSKAISSTTLLAMHKSLGSDHFDKLLRIARRQANGANRAARQRDAHRLMCMFASLHEAAECRDSSHMLNVLLTLNETLDLGQEGEAAVKKEIRAILDHGSWKPKYDHELSKQQKYEAISSFLFGKRKLSGDLKGRLIQNGKQLPKREAYQNLFSPTSNPMTTMIHLGVAAHEKREHLFTADFPNAYLKVDRKEHDMPVEHTRLTGKLAKLICEVEPSFLPYMRNGILYCEIMKSVYGLTESAALWFKQLRDMLIAQGFQQQLQVDPCLFIHPKTKSAINVHVDDCLVSCKTKTENSRIRAFFEQHKCKVHEGKFTFLGMDIHHVLGKGVKVSMETFLKDKFSKWNVTGIEKYPHKPSLADLNDSSPPSKRREEFVNKVMTLLFAGIRARIDILLTVAILSQHCAAPTEKNFNDLEHLLRYVNGTMDKAIYLSPSSLDAHIYADSSFMLYPDRKGQTGIVVTLGPHGPCVGTRCAKQKMNVSSSTDGEVLTSFEGIPITRLVTALLRAFSYDHIPVLHQDNKSSIQMMEEGKSSSKHTKHFDMRLQVLNEMIRNAEMYVEYTPDTDMPADLFTKPITGKKWDTYMEALMHGELPKTVTSTWLASSQVSMATSRPSRGRARTSQLPNPTGESERS